MFKKYPYKACIGTVCSIEEVSEYKEYVTIFDRELAWRELRAGRVYNITEHDIDAEIMRHNKEFFDHVEYKSGRPECVKRLTTIYHYRIEIEYCDKNGKKYINTITFQTDKRYEKNDKLEICYMRDDPNKIKLPNLVNSDRDLKNDLLWGIMTLGLGVVCVSIFLSNGK